MMKKQALLWLVPVILLAGVFSGCDNGGDGGGADAGGSSPVKPRGTTNFLVSPAQVSLAKGAKQQFKAYYDGKAANPDTWTVSNGSGSAFDEDDNGVLTVSMEEAAGVLKVSASLTVKGKKVEAQALVTVLGNGAEPLEHGISISPSIVEADKGETLHFTAVFSATGEAASGVTWDIDSENTDLTTGITDGALVIGEDETAQILTVKAELGDKYGTAAVYIKGNGGKNPDPEAPVPVVDGLVVDPQTVTAAYGETKQFIARDYDGAEVTGVIWRVTSNGADAASTITDGLLTVAELETAEYLVVRAEKNDGSGENGTAVVTVKERGADAGTGNEPEDFGLKVNPQRVIVKKGVSQPFSAVESESGTPASGVTWTVTGGVDGTEIGTDGVLTVDEGETAAELVVKAALSDDDADTWGTAVVYVEDNGASPPDGVPQNSGISVSPSEADIARGSDGTFSASGASNITWDFDGESVSTLSEASGESTVLTVAAAETAGKLTLKATDADDPGKYGTAVVSVSGEAPPVELTFNSVAANSNSTATTTALTLTFSAAIAGLTADDIIISAANGSPAQVSKGSALSGSGPSYTLPVTVSAGGLINVSVSKTGYVISPASREVTVYYIAPVTSVTLSGVSANGTANTTTTTELTLTFGSPGISGLTANDITLSPELTKGSLTVSGMQWKLAVSGISAETSVTVTVSKTGYSISGNGKNVTVHYVTPVTLNSVLANGVAKIETTTELTLNFSAAITGLTANDINISAANGSPAQVSRGTTLGVSGHVYTLPVTVSAGGLISVSVSKAGYSISGNGKTVTVHYNKPYTPEMVQVAGGNMTLNGTNVTLSSFWISNHEVTQKEWTDVMGDVPGDEQWYSGEAMGDNYPAYFISWYDAVEFCNALSDQKRLTKAYEINGEFVTLVPGADGYRLPTEAEWEYAARGGLDSQGYEYSGSDNVDDVAWHHGNSNIMHPVGEKQANELGLYDMSGNLYEWCWDEVGLGRALRGGCYYYEASNVRSVFREYCPPMARLDVFGFRVARSVTP
jgi:formylglycine-generating enzyme required for sulfatase activity/DNA-binding protein YbaB